MKTLLYTVSDFSDKARDCIDLLLSNIDKSDDFDFVVVSNNKNHPKDISVVVDNSNINYIGDLKYSLEIPKGYSRYVYLDSDILFYGSIKDLYDEDKDYSLVFENIPMNLHFFSYPYSDDNHKNMEKNLLGLNAGTFSFKNHSFLQIVREKISNVRIHNPVTAAMYEQSALNYVISKLLNYDFSLAKNLTPITSLFAQEHPYDENKKIYHFCGFNGSMINKYRLMENFNNAVLRNKK